MASRTAASLILLLLPACAGRAGAPANPVPTLESVRGVYEFRGLIAGRAVNGLVELGDAVDVTSNLGQCRQPLRSVRLQVERALGGRRLIIECGLTLALRWDLEGNIVSPASATLPTAEERTVRGPCVRWGAVPPQGGQPPCLEYERRIETSNRLLTGDLQVTKR